MNISSYHTGHLLSKPTNFKDTDLLNQYVTEQGKILPRRTTGLSAKSQKQITKSIKRARILSLMSFRTK